MRNLKIILGRIVENFNRINFKNLLGNNEFAFNNHSYKKIVPVVILVVFVLITIILVFYLVRNSKNPSEIIIKDAKDVYNVEKEFLFPIFDDKGKEVYKLKYIIQNVEKRDEIVVKGQRARSVKGRTFLIVNIKIVNDFNQPITIQSRDYVRFSLNGDKNQWLAPDIHNDPIEIQAISTKLIRVGLAVNDSDNNIVLRVGEINGNKTEIEVKI